EEKPKFTLPLSRALPFNPPVTLPLSAAKRSSSAAVADELSLTLSMLKYDWSNVQPFYLSQEGYKDSEDVVEEVKEVIPLKFELKVSHEAKTRELLRNIVSSEIKLCSHGVKEFKKCLRGESGGEFLSQYVRSSSKFSELMEAWRIRQNKPGFIYIVSLITAILDHPDGKYTPDDPGRVQISRALDMFSKSIMEEKLEDLYKELNSKEGKRQKVALLLLAAIVRRGSVLASEVANVFDFKMPMFPKLAEYRRKGVLVKRKVSTRGAFIEFAMSFLEVGQPGLLRWILQQREMFSGVLRGLGNDDDETVVYVLSTLRDRVLISESLLGPGLRSVLFGSITLEQLANISGRESGSLAAEVAYGVLIMVCTNPANGLMPDFSGKMGSLRGNPKRMLDLMKKLKPTDVMYHRELLLAVFCGRPVLASSYLDNFPFNLEDHSSPAWLSAVSLAADLVSSVNANLSWDFLKRSEKGLPSLHTHETLLKCVCPRTFSRSAISKGLQNKACTIQHGTLRFLFESLKLLDAFFNALMLNELSSLKQEIQNEVRNLLPDLQLMFNILNSLGNKYKNPINSQKPPHQPANSESVTVNDNEGLKINTVEDDDILIGGVSSTEQSPPLEGKNKRKVSQLDKSHTDNDILKITDLWKMEKCSFTLAGPEDTEVLFHCKLLEVFKICHCALHSVIDVSYDIFKIVPGNLVELPSDLLRSLLPLLLEHIGWPSKFGSSGFIPPIYKHLQSFVKLLLYASNEDIKQQGCLLAQAALLSTGAFDVNPLDIRAWFLFIPGYAGEFVADPNVKLLQKLSQPVISFLCNAVSTVGNRLLKYWNDIKSYTCNLKDGKDVIIYFSPLVVCILERCLQLLRSDSGTFTVSDKAMISLYVCNTLKYLLETQVDCQFLAYFIHDFLSNENVCRSSKASDPDNVACEWRPLNDLHLFSEKILHQELCTSLFAERSFVDASMSFTTVLREVEKASRDGSAREQDAVSVAFYSSLLCTDPDQILQNLPSILDISENLYGCHHALITPLLFLDPNLLVSFFRSQPKIFIEGLELSVLKTKDSQLSSPIKPSNSKDGSADSASLAFGAFLEHIPFHFLLPPIIISGYSEHHSKVKELLCNKLSKMAFDQLILSLRLVLFWVHQVQLSFREKPSDGLQRLSQTCYEILRHIFDCVSALKSGTAFLTDKSPSLVSQYLPVVAETIFSHPVVAMSFSIPLEYCNNFTEELPQDSLEELVCALGHGVHEMNHHIYNLLSISCDLLLTQCRDLIILPKNKDCMNKIMKGLNKLVKQVFLLFREKFDLGIKTQNLMVLFPILYGVLSFLRYISPYELLELANWIFYRVSSEEFMPYKTSNISPICVGFIIAAGAFTMIDSSLQLPAKEESFGMLFDGTYQKAVNFSVQFNLHSACLCLVEALNAVWRHKCNQDLIFLCMMMGRVISNTPIQIISHCIHATNGPKSKILMLLIKDSPLHMSIFGRLFIDILEDCSQRLAEKDYLMLLPAALTYFSSSVTKFGKQYAQKFEKFRSFYARILLEGFLNWNSFVYQRLFEMECGPFLTSSSDEFLKGFSSSLLGNAVLMLKNYFAGKKETKDERLILFDSICANDIASEGLLDFEIKKIKSYSVSQFLNLINRVIAKITLCQALLYPDDDQIQVLSEGADDDSRKFLDKLVHAWKLIVKKVPSTSYKSGKEFNCYCLVKFLEMFILGSIVKLAKKMSDVLVQLDSLPFLEKIIKYSLLYRFGDYATFKLIRSTLCSLSKGTLPTKLFLQLLLGHSQLASSVLSINDSSICQTAGLFSRPISSILGSLVISSGENSRAEKLKANVYQLEIIKLLRTLYHLNFQNHASFSDSSMDINSRELLFLLLSSYGATISEVDLEIYAFMQEIESVQGENGCCVAELDFLWGPATIRIRKELEQEQPISMKNDANEVETDQRKSRFRANLLIDPKFCVATVLNFPYKRTLTEPFLLNESEEDYAHKSNSENFQQILCYDPVFILRFSIHCLSMEYLNPVEFAGLGLLAVALVSISSPDEAIRKLGYEVLGKFKDILEKCSKKKDVMGLKLLLKYVQNEIEDPSQKIPSIHAIFAAEASLVLLDPSHDHYAAISKHLTKTPRKNVKSIPFFDRSSSSIDFKADRQWMLRLLYAGINLEDDAPVYMKKSVLEILISFYACPLSDTKSKELILEVVKKSVKLKRMAYHLVQDSGLIMWLSSILPSCLSLDRSSDLCSTKLLVMLLEVAKDAVSFRRNVEWLQLSGFEQFSDFSSRLFRILVSGSNFVQRNSDLVISILEVVMIAMKISMERNICQPHFTLSFGCSYKLYQAIRSCGDDACSESGLKAILMSAPPVSILHMDYQELSQFLVWATSTALRLDSANTLKCTDSHNYVADLGETRADSFSSKLLRWLVASVILGRISSNLDDLYFTGERTSIDSLLSFMKQFSLENRNAGTEEVSSVLAAVIFHLQQLIGTKCSVLSSVVAALSILLFQGTSCSNGSEMNGFDGNHVSDMWSKIHCPPEPWAEDKKSKRTDLEQIDQLHACQGLIVIISSVLQKKSSDSESRALSLKDLQDSGVFQWERMRICSRKRRKSTEETCSESSPSARKVRKIKSKKKDSSGKNKGQRT
ncbi:LOW QUALITY PROTEIN: hypothetical protein V2J09_001495, partial [Rumex salicifolius]